MIRHTRSCSAVTPRSLVQCARSYPSPPLPVGTRVRGRAEIVSVGDLGGAAVQVKIRVTIEAEGSDKPVCVADTLSRLYF